MSSTDPPLASIAPGSSRDRSARVGEGAPTRALLASERCRLFRKGGPSKADLLLVDAGASRWIVKDFRHKPWWARCFGRLLVAREARAYRALAGIRGVPPFVGRLDAHALAVGHVEAVPLAFAPERTQDGARRLAELRGIVDAIHRAGVVHCDLRGRDNVLVDRQGHLWIVDFASAIRLRPGGLAHRAAFRWLEQIDQAALLKWKRIVEAGPLTGEEQALFRRFRTLRPLWLHRRQAWRGRGGPQA